MAPLDLKVSGGSVVRPADPAPLKLEDVQYGTCGQRYCVTPREIKKEFRNKTKVGRYVSQSKAAIDYYKSVTEE